MKTQDLATVETDFLLSSTTPLQRGQMLVACASENDRAGLQKLITAEPSIIKRAGEDALAQACAKGHLDVVKRLHAVGVKIDGFLFDDNNPAVTIAQYPLHCAFENSQWEVAQWLVDHGAKVMHMPRVLGNMVNKAPVLFRRMLEELPYISAYENRASAPIGSDDKVMGDALLAALEVIAYNEYVNDAAIVLQAGLSPHSLYDVAARKHSYAVLRDLYESGYRPDAAQKEAHLALLAAGGNDQQRAARVRDLVQAWTYADNHIALDAEAVAHQRTVLLQGFDAGADVPAALVLARHGEFSGSVARYLPQAGMDLLLLKDRHGATLLDTLVVRGEVMQVFDPAIWRGNFAQAVALHGQLPAHVQAQVDLMSVHAAFGRHHMGSGNARFKFSSRGKGG